VGNVTLTTPTQWAVNISLTSPLPPPTDQTGSVYLHHFQRQEGLQNLKSGSSSVTLSKRPICLSLASTCHDIPTYRTGNIYIQLFQSSGYQIWKVGYPTLTTTPQGAIYPFFG